MSAVEKGRVAPLKNVGRLECSVRVLAGIWLTAHAVDAAGRPFLAIAWGVVGLFVLGTGLLRVCPVYTLIRGRPGVASRRP